MASVVGVFDPDLVGEGDMVAIIDCMTFVPEYIPVLRALEQHVQHGLPFEQGALLNLDGARPADLGNTVDVEGVFGDISGKDSAALPRATITMLVEEMVDNSRLQPIREIRQNEGLSCSLKGDLVDLIEQTTLDQGQLVNFIDGLRNPVHLTQGPPGTGKSYLGVVLVRALIRVRKYWMQQNPSVGSPPILVLSYKNHAADEFLLDLVKAEPQTFSSAKWRKSELIRMGKPGDPSLTPFAESTLTQKGNPDVAICKGDLQQLIDLREACRAVCSAALLFLSYHGEMFNAGHAGGDSAEDEGAKRKRQSSAAYEATEVLHAGLVRARWLENKFRRKKKKPLLNDTSSGLPSGNNSLDDNNTPDHVGDVPGTLRNVAAFMTLDDPGDHRCRKLQELAKKPDMRSDLAELYRGMAHYIEIDPTYDEPHEMLHMFLKGVRPLPRCVLFVPESDGHSHQCDELAICHEVALCNAHRCHSPSGPDRARCENPIDPRKRLLCRTHGCELPGCDNRRLLSANGNEAERLCAEHVCFKCIELGCVPAKEACDEPPRNVCWDHPLCCADRCLELTAARGDDYCALHAHTRCQHYQAGRQCKEWGIARDLPYCQYHVEAFLSRQEAEEAAAGAWSRAGAAAEEYTSSDPELAAAVKLHNAKRTCAGMTKKKKPCKSCAAPESNYCHAHAPPEESYERRRREEERLKNEKEQGVQKQGVKEKDAAAELRADVRPPTPNSGTDEGLYDTSKTKDNLAEEEVFYDICEAEVDVNLAEEEGDQSEEASGPWMGPQPADFTDSGGYDNIDEVEEADGMRHLREIFEVDEGDADVDAQYNDDAASSKFRVAAGDAGADSGSTGSRSGPFGASFSTAQQNAVPQREIPQHTREWTWEMPLEARWEACQHFMQEQIDEMRALLELVGQQLDVARKKLRDAQGRANTKVYENRTVIGGTIVGCVTRLEAIRATRPFAIVVEEASEVLEPLLLACLCPSTVKFQMVGDHLQLQPGLMDKFDFMHINKVNVSMFERLVQAPEGHRVPTGVLAVQRRMRKDVCDLTRDYYTDIVAIEDHDVCRTKVLPGVDAGRSFWRGREVPGVQSHIFLWTHSGEQSRAEVGLSKINRHEADLCVQLAYYLVSCGVQKKSIAILTPYKGQLMLLRKLLLRDRSKQALLVWDASVPDQIRLSTVDRFQGDEADVVLVSLVVDEHSRTPFVKQRNRMIVLLSRARLGMYVLGNVRYFEGLASAKGGGREDAKHWTQTLETLQQAPAVSDNSEAKLVSADAANMTLTQAKFEHSRTGSKLPLCCPQHPLESRLEVDKGGDLKLGFCEIPCAHAPGARQGVDSIDAALSQYECPVEVTVPLPCTHELKLTCAVEDAISEGRRPYPDCTRPSPHPFIYPDCGHKLGVTCAQLVLYERDPSKVKKCAEKVSYHPKDCDHVCQMKCYLERQYRDGTATFMCTARLEVPLPRCGHAVQVSCAQHVALQRWEPGPDDERHHGAAEAGGVTTVHEGTRYGPKDYACREKVMLVRRCGHEQEMLCEEAFLKGVEGEQSRPCPIQVSAVHPHCGHSCKLSCAVAQRLRDVPRIAEAPCNEVHEGAGVAFPRNLPPSVPACSETVTLHRACGHVELIPCVRAHAPTLPRCSEAVQLVSPLCGHEISAPCHLKAAIESWRPWSEEVEAELRASASLRHGAKPHVPLPDNAAVTSCLKGCDKRVTVSKSCGHTFPESCPELLRIVGDDGGTVRKGANCIEIVTRELPDCGHSVTVPCKRWQQFVDGKLEGGLPCKAQVTRPCWNAAECGSEALAVPCATPADAVICCDKRTRWQCPAIGEHAHNLQVCCTGAPSSCPDCNLALMDDAIQAAQKEIDDAALRVVGEVAETQAMAGAGFLRMFDGPVPGRSFVDECLQSVRREAVTPLPPTDESMGKFRRAQISCLKKFKLFSGKAASPANVFQRQQFEPALVPVFFVVSAEKRAAEEQVNGFIRMGPFVRRQTLDGVALRRLTPDNIRGLAGEVRGGASKTLLCGYAYVLNGKTGRKWPSKKSQTQSVKAWREDEGRDCVEFEPEARGSPVRKLVVWDPYPLHATHRVGPLSAEELNQLACGMALAGCETSTGMTPRFIEFSHNGAAGGGAVNVVRGVACKSAPQDTQGPDASAGEDGAALTHTIAALRGSWAEHLHFVRSSKAAEEGADQRLVLRLSEFSEGISEAAERDLVAKVTFISKGARSPFAGKKLLEKLHKSSLARRTKGSESDASRHPCLLQLLLALEFFEKDDVDRARDELSNYCRELRAIMPMLPVGAHPLLLLAFARMGVPDVSSPSSAPDAAQVLYSFMESYADMGERLLTAEEREAVRRLARVDADEEDHPDTSARPINAPLPRVDAVDEWQDFKEKWGVESDAMEQLLRMTGLRKVKAAAVRLFKMGQCFAQMNASKRALNAPTLNYVFLGNPGTGKTTVARLFSRILHDTGIREKAAFVESGGQELKEKGADEFKKLASSAMDGVLFIDEAYTLDPVGDRFKGAPIANELLTWSENERKRLTFILAGYEDELSKKLFEYNPGFRSRFTEVHFEDFDEEELLTVWNHLREERQWDEADPRVGKVVVRRLAKMKGRKGFGNAREVRKKLEHACDCAMAREDFDPGHMALHMADAVGENPLHNGKLRAAVDQIERMTGWVKVKQGVRDLVKVCGENYERELNGQEPLPVFLNRMFLGNPGTGKTSCARLYGEVLKQLGFLSNGEVVEKTAGDLGGQVVGESKQKTVALVEASRGKVLVIDEAYGLDDSVYGRQALDALVERVQGSEADDIAVLLLGYEEEMRRMLDNQNPGLRRRFDPEQAFLFEDYTEQELEQILLNLCKTRNYKPTLEFREKAVKKLEMQKRSEAHFGNAGSVENLLKAALARASAARGCSPDGSMRLEAEDIDLGPEAELKEGEDPFVELDGLYRMEHVKRSLKQLQSKAALAEDEGDERPKLGHFVFTGAPGTGKTTVARILAKLLYRSGLLAKFHVEETTGLSLTGDAMGQTKKRVEEKLAAAKGGVLFIDEAYELGKGSYGAEACAALVGAMTDERHAGLVIVMAGYQAEMQNMLDVNCGLKSRFEHFIEFPDWDAADCVDLFKRKAESGNFALEGIEDVSSRVLERGFKKLLPLKGWGNARDVAKVWESANQERADRLQADGGAPGGGGDQKVLIEADIRAAMDQLVNARLGISGSGAAMGAADPNVDPFAPLHRLYRMEAVREKLSQLKNTVAVALRDGEEPPPLGHFVFSGAPGTGKTTVARALAGILYKLELVSRNKVTETSGLDLTGEVVGATKKKVSEKLDEAKGGVLFIDEAYELAKGQFGVEALTTLVAAMTAPEYAGLTVIIAGYKADIDTMLGVNIGLKSRFKHFIEFPDFKPEDCFDLFQAKARESKLEVDLGAVGKILLPGFKKLLPLDGWANARDVDTLWDAVKQNRANRVMNDAADVMMSTNQTSDCRRVLTVEDVRGAMEDMIAVRLGSGASHDRTVGREPFAALDNLYGMQEVKRTLQQLQNVYDVAMQDGADKPPLGHFIFVGSPGTGKTTVARAMSGILHKLGLIGRDHVEQTSGLDLQGQYLGQTKQTVKEVLGHAKGGVLFIDEAYTLGQGQYGMEACDALVAAMTDPQYAAGSTSSSPTPPLEMPKQEDCGSHRLEELENLHSVELETEVNTEAETTVTVISQTMAEEMLCKEVSNGGLFSQGGTAAGRDQGVSDDVWAELQMVMEEEKRHEEKLHAEEEERKRIEAELEAKLQAKQLAKEAYEAEMQELQRRREEAKGRERERERIQRKLRKIGNCPVGFTWSKVAGGWRCRGGSHFVPDNQLDRDFGYDA
eukprot:gene3981-4950_t